MASLPTPGGSDGVWGTRLNEYLEVEHDSGGAHEIVLVGARMYSTAAQSEVDATTKAKKVTIDTDDYDYNNLTDTANNKITVDKDGIYVVNGQVKLTNVVVNAQITASVYKNGSPIYSNVTTHYAYSSTYTTATLPFSFLNSASATDYFQLYITVAGDTSVDVVPGSGSTFLEVYRVGVAAS